MNVLDDLGAFPRVPVLESVLGTMIASIKHLIFSEPGAVNHAMIHHGMIISYLHREYIARARRRNGAKCVCVCVSIKSYR